MKALQINPVIRACGPRDSCRPAALTIEETGHDNAIWRLLLQEDGSLEAVGPMATAEQILEKTVGETTTVTLRDALSTTSRLQGFLRLRTDAGRANWFFVPASRRLGINGVTPPLPAVLLQPGTLLSLADEFWIVSSLWSPEPIDAPPDLAEKECPVCGLELKCSPVAACLCGNYMHLESPNQPDDPEALNCYLTKGICGSCQRPTSLEPQTVPEIPETLLAFEVDDDWGAA